MIKKSILICAFSLFSWPVMAEWISVMNDTTRAYYVDPSTIRKSGDVVKIWELVDLASPKSMSNGTTYRSMINQTEYDCLREASRPIFVTIYEGNMGKGSVLVTSNTEVALNPIIPHSKADKVLKYVCVGG